MTVKHVDEIQIDQLSAGTGASRQVLIGPDEAPHFALRRFIMEPGGGIPALKKALQYRLYAHINVQETIDVDERTIVFRMNDCRVQSARKRKGLPDFPCKPVGVVEYGNFASTIDPRFHTRCIACPPDDHPEEYWCAWEFTLDEKSS